MELIFNKKLDGSQLTDAEKQHSKSGKDKNGLVSDNDPSKQGENALYKLGDPSKDQGAALGLESLLEHLKPEVDTLKSSPVNLNEHHHGPSIDNSAYHMDRVI